MVALTQNYGSLLAYSSTCFAVSVALQMSSYVAPWFACASQMLSVAWLGSTNMALYRITTGAGEFMAVTQNHQRHGPPEFPGFNKWPTTQIFAGVTEIILRTTSASRITGVLACKSALLHPPSI